MEQMLIARVAPVMLVMRLPEYRGAQWRFKGHVVCFPQDIQPVVSVLPRVSVDVNIDISVLVENLEQLPNDGPLQLRLDQYVTEPRHAHW